MRERKESEPARIAYENWLEQMTRLEEYEDWLESVAQKEGEGHETRGQVPCHNLQDCPSVKR